MGWVTLTLRKTELKRSHADYQMELLKISRTKRQMARQYHFQQSEIRNEQQIMLREFRNNYNEQRSLMNEFLSSANQNGGSTTIGEQQVDANGNQMFDNNGDPIFVTGTEKVVTATELQNDLDELRLEYQEEVNATKMMYEDELAMIEEEANDTETDLDQQQVEIEAQLEAISAEIEAVGEGISYQVQASTIKLS